MNKIVYEKPYLVTLNTMPGARGAFCNTGSGDASKCQTGTFAGKNCNSGGGVVEKSCANGGGGVLPGSSGDYYRPERQHRTSEM